MRACDIDPISRSRQPQPCNNSGLNFTWTGSFAVISNTVSSKSIINYDYNLCWVQRIHPLLGGGGGGKKQGNMSFIHKKNIKIWWFFLNIVFPSNLLACVWLFCVCVWFAIHAVLFYFFCAFCVCFGYDFTGCCFCFCVCASSLFCDQVVFCRGSKTEGCIHQDKYEFDDVSFISGIACLLFCVEFFFLCVCVWERERDERECLPSDGYCWQLEAFHCVTWTGWLLSSFCLLSLLHSLHMYILATDYARQLSKWCDICEAVKVVLGNQSDNHCNQSDAWPSILLLELY